MLEGEEEIRGIEMQNVVDTKILPKRARYYQSAADINFLVKGQDYTKLKKSYIIFLSKEKFDLERKCTEAIQCMF